MADIGRLFLTTDTYLEDDISSIHTSQVKDHTLQRMIGNSFELLAQPLFVKCMMAIG